MKRTCASIFKRKKNRSSISDEILNYTETEF